MSWLQFAAYFAVMFLFFGAVWKGIDKAYSALERKHEREFREKVDRYRR